MPSVALIFVRIGNGGWESKIEEPDSFVSFWMNGEVNAIDLHYYFKANREPEIGSKLRVLLNTDEMSDYDTLFVVDPALSGFLGLRLVDTTMCEKLFLRGLSDAIAWIQNREIYANFMPVNEGLESFVGRTGMRGLLNK